MTIEYLQVGGFTGSHSGDCAVFKIGHDRVVLDLGRKQQSDRGYNEASSSFDVKSGKAALLISHFHTDHISDGKRWNDYKKMTPQVFWGQALTNTGQGYLANAKTIFPDAKIIDTARVVYDGETDGWRLRITAIGPDLSKAKPNPDENDASLISVIQVFHGNHLQWSQLSLGDATPRAGNDRTQELLESLESKPASGKFDSVKLSHHGSEKNFLPVLDGYIGENTQIIISGYSLTGIEKLTEKLQAWTPHSPRLLLFDSSINAKEHIGEANLNKLSLNGVQIQTEYHRKWPLVL